MMSQKVFTLAALLIIGAFLAGVFVGDSSVAAPQDQGKVDGFKALQKLMAARSEMVKLGSGEIVGKPTDLNFRLTVTVEDQEKNSKKVLDSLFNQDGDLVSLQTTDAILAQRVKARIAAGVDECYNRCKHHLQNGEAHKYAVCFYACLIEP